ncbi:MAG TPA: IclR family transcriptional regulator [Candidatus Dormibacteraeota bacterium]|nr:IclR family transcriptional regulator [Candidatus Dormibacteraeota bacterium]
MSEATQSVVRAVRLLVLVGRRLGASNVTELALESGLAVPTAYRLLSTLVSEGLLEKDSASRYWLGPKVGLLAETYQQEGAPPPYLIQPLEALRDRTGETVYLAGWRRGKMRILHALEGTQPVHVSVPIDAPYTNAHARATGKLLLAFAPAGQSDGYLPTEKLQQLTPNTITTHAILDAQLQEIRTRGYAFDDEEFQVGVGCVSAAALDGTTILAAFSLSAPISRFLERRDELLAAATEAASRVTRTPPIPVQATPTRRRANSSIAPFAVSQPPS